MHIPFFERQLEVFVINCTSAIARMLVELHRRSGSRENLFCKVAMHPAVQCCQECDMAIKSFTGAEGSAVLLHKAIYKQK